MTLYLKALVLSVLYLLLGGCSTLGGFLGTDDPADGADMAETAANDVEPMADPQQEAINQQEIDQQAKRINRVEGALSQLLLQQRSLAAQMENVKAETKKREAARLAAEVNQQMTKERRTEAANAMAIHLASYELESSIEPGWNDIVGSLPDNIKSKQVRISKATVKGKEYNRLLLGPYDTRAAAKDACATVRRRLSFCDVMAFTGYVFK